MQNFPKSMFGPLQGNCPVPAGGGVPGNPFPGSNPSGSTNHGHDHRSHCEPARVVIAGGALQQLLTHQSVIPFEEVFRRNPVPGVFGASQNQPFSFECGAFTVPAAMILAVAEFSFKAYRFSGSFANESVLIDQGLATLDMGLDLNVEQVRKGNVTFELVPIDPSIVQNAFSPQQTGGIATSGKSINLNPIPVAGAPAALNIFQTPATSTQNQKAFVQGSGIGSSLMPYSDRPVQGPERLPFTFYAEESQSVQMRVAIFRKLNIPIAFFETRLVGYMLPTNILRALREQGAPCAEAGK